MWGRYTACSASWRHPRTRDVNVFKVVGTNEEGRQGWEEEMGEPK